MMLRRGLPLLFGAITSSFAVSAHAETVNARCEYYPNGQSRATVAQSCTFSQRQGNVSIQWADGINNEFTAVGSSPGNYVDQRGGAVYRQAGLGDHGTIFKMVNGSTYVYWNTAASVNRPTPARQKGISTLRSDTPGGRINVRSQPTVNSSTPSYGIAGDSVRVNECVEDRDVRGSGLNWCKVQFVQSKASGWVRSDFIIFADGGE